MKSTTLPMLTGSAATRAYRNEFSRRAERIADKPVSLGTHYSATESPSEPTSNPRWYPDELPDHYTAHVRARTTFMAIVCLVILTVAAMAVLAWVWKW